MARCRLAAALPRIVFTMKRPIRAFTFAAPRAISGLKYFRSVFSLIGRSQRSRTRRRICAPARPGLDGAALLVRRLKPRPTAPACHVDSPIDDFLLPLSARRVRVFMHTRTEVRIRARGGGGLERKKPR